MWFHSLLASWKSGRSRCRRPQPRLARRGMRLILEHLEDRSLPSSYSAASVSDLTADINAANTAGGANTITLTAPTTSPYVLNNTTNGASGLPVIAGNDNLTIVGNGDTIERSTAAGTPAFRLLEVAGSLTLENLTLQGGLAQCSGYNSSSVGPVGSGVSGGGGAIYNQGTLVLNGVTVQDNMAVGLLIKGSPYGGNAAGGGIFSTGGSVTLEGGTVVQNNEAQGATVQSSSYGVGDGGNAYGGGMFAYGGTLTVSNAALDNNAAVAGDGYSNSSVYGPAGKGGNAYGGGLFAANGYGKLTVTMTNATVEGNVAQSTQLISLYAAVGISYGGGLYLGGATATLTSCTVPGNSAGVWASSATYGFGNVGEGGGLYVAGGTVTLVNDTVQSNTSAYQRYNGGEIFISGATVHIDAFTLAHTSNIEGTYIET